MAFIRKSKLKKIDEVTDKLNFILSRNNVVELAEILGNKRQILLRNLIARNI